MAIKQPRRFVTTDQGHADVLNVPIDTLYENDQALAAQLESIKTDPAGNDIASKAALDKHAADTNLHVTAAKQATWSAAEANAKQYTQTYAAPKAHTHSASELPSASTQARGITQLNTSTNSAVTDQAATPSAVKAANDRANEAYSRADAAFTQAVDLKNKIIGAINGKFGGASPDMSSDQIAGVITNAPVKRFASGTFNGQNAQATSSTNGVDMTVSVALPFTVKRVFIRVVLEDTQGTSTSRQVDGFVMTSSVYLDNKNAKGWRNNFVGAGYLEPPIQGFNVKLSSSRIDAYAGGTYLAKLSAWEWWAFE
ncbi:phage tail protein [Paenibacillus sp. NRS-1783]|uniref:phage tail protein n=1 Tax=Paenibacillus sp. NRS-1783 TaxID=3233907 RepID=UPI003D29489B